MMASDGGAFGSGMGQSSQFSSDTYATGDARKPSFIGVKKRKSKKSNEFNKILKNRPLIASRSNIKNMFEDVFDHTDVIDENTQLTCNIIVGADIGSDGTVINENKQYFTLICDILQKYDIDHTISELPDRRIIEFKETDDNIDYIIDLLPKYLGEDIISNNILILIGDVDG